MLFSRLPVRWPCRQQVTGPVMLGAPMNDEIIHGVFVKCFEKKKSV